MVVVVVVAVVVLIIIIIIIEIKTLSKLGFHLESVSISEGCMGHALTMLLLFASMTFRHFGKGTSGMQDSDIRQNHSFKGSSNAALTRFFIARTYCFEIINT